MKNIVSVFLLMMIMGAALSGCRNVSPENTDYKESQNNVTETSDTSVSEGTISDNIPEKLNLIQEENFQYIIDVSAVGKEIYISGSEDTKPVNYITAGDLKTELSFSDSPVCYEFFNGLFYCFLETENDGITLKIINPDDVTSEKNIDTDYKNGYFKIIDDNSFAFYDGELILYNWNEDTEVKSKISDYLSGNIFIESDSDGNIYLFYEDKEYNKVLSKYDRNLNIIYTENFSDMFGTIQDISFSAGILELITYDDQSAMYLTNQVDYITGKTTDRTENESYTFDEDWISLSGKRISFGTEHKTRYYTSVKDVTGETVKTIDLEAEKDGLISKVFTDGDSLYYIEEDYNAVFLSDENGREEKHIIHKIDKDLNHSSVSVDALDSMSYTQFFAVDSSGNYSIIEKCDDIYYFSQYDSFGNCISSFSDNSIFCINSYVFCNNNIYLDCFDSNENSNIKVWSEENKNIIDFEANVSECAGLFKSSNQKSFLIKDFNGAVLINSEDGNVIKKYNLFDFQTEDYKLCYIGDNCFVKYNDNECSVFCTNNVNSQNEIILAVSHLNDELKENIDKYNNETKESRISVVQYGFDENAFNNMNLDMVQGKIDIIVSNSNFDIEEYDKDIFMDMSELFSSEFDENEYYTNVLNIYSENGMIYELVPFFNLKCMTGYSDVVPASGRWSINEFVRFNDNYNAEFTFYDTYDFLSCIVMNSIENGRVTLNQNDLKNLFDCILKGYIGYGDGESLPDVKLWCSEVTRNGYYMLEDEPDTNIGYPSENGAGILVKPEYGFSVLNSSEHKTEAWNFIKKFLEREYQMKSSLTPSSSLPVMRKACEKVLKDSEIKDEKYANCIKMIENADCKTICEYSKKGLFISETLLDVLNGETNSEDAALSLINKLDLFMEERE